MQRHDAHFSMALSLKMHLHTYLGWPGPVTHRQHEAWQYFLRQQWDRPRLTDHYLMQLTKAVDDIPPRVWGKKGSDRKIEEYRLRWQVSEPPKSVRRNPAEDDPNYFGPKRITKENIERYERAARQAAIGGKADRGVKT